MANNYHAFMGIPTLYKGVHFRSRLEAKWAVFFDLCKWRWEYEPCDFDGWIPDFLIIGRKQKIFAEVKPVTELPLEVATKIDASRCDDEVLILGMAIPLKATGGISDDALLFGWLREDMGEGRADRWCWGGAILGRWKDGGGQLGFCHEYQSYHDRISGGYDGGCWGELSLSGQEVERMWRRAGNRIQWPQNHQETAPPGLSESLADLEIKAMTEGIKLDGVSGTNHRPGCMYKPEDRCRHCSYARSTRVWGPSRFGRPPAYTESFVCDNERLRMYNVI